MASIGVAAVAGTGFAQEAKPAPVIQTTIYGQLHASVDSIDSGDARDLYLSSNTSRLGFKGSAPMSDTLNSKVIWQVEGFIGMDEKDSNGFFVQRNTYIGVETDAGKALVGRHDTPFKSLVSKIDLFNERIGDAANMTGAGGKGWDQRPDNAMLYQSPAIGGVTLVGVYCAEEDADQSEQISGSALWEKSGIFAGGGYERHGKKLTGSDSNGDGTIDTASAAAEEGYRAIAGYAADFGSVAAVYQKLLNVAGIDSADSTLVGGMAACNIGKETVKVQYLSRDDDGDKAGASMLVIGVDHNFSNKLLVYLTYAAVNNEANSAYSMSGDGHGEKVTPAKGKDSSGVGIGMIYKF